MTHRLRAEVRGPLAEFADGFGVELRCLGYSARGSEGQLYLMKHLSQWLAEERMTAGDLTAETASRFLTARRLSHTQWRSEKALQPLLAHLRTRGVAPAVPPMATIEMPRVIEERFASYLADDRGLAATTIRSYVFQVRPFLSEHAYSEDAIARLTPRLVANFVTERAVGRRPGSVAVGAKAVRVLLRWMWREQIVSSQLADSVGSVAVRRDTAPPRSLSAAEITAVFETLRPATRLRDEPMLALMCRLGLRAGEVASLVLDDVKWRNGLLVVLGKGSRRETVPLPTDVGALIASYVQQGRPAGTAHRQVFLSLAAPHRPLVPASVSDVAARALAAAGVSGPGAAHRFRHTAGCGVLAAGGGLIEAGQLLRHSSAAATAVYARSDLGALAVLARPWPTGASR